MKNLTKLLGIIALAAAIGFSFTACDDGNNDNGRTDPVYKVVLARAETYTANGELSEYSEYEYDSNGNQTKYSYYESGTFRRYTTYTYKTIKLG